MIQYKIYKNVYDAIKSGNKKIEFRLLNEKSSAIKAGDVICFQVEDDETLKLRVRVIDTIIFDSIEDLWEHQENKKENIFVQTREELKEGFYEIFGREKVMVSKIIGICFELLKQ